MSSASDALLPAASSGGGAHGHRNQLGLWNGVYVPCLLTILGVILYVRIGWGVAQGGWVTMLGMFLVGETLSVFTVLSMATLVSNGDMKGGGSYFLISRCLGPEMGGGVGFVFYLAYAFSTSFHMLGLASNIMDAFLADVGPEERYSYEVGISSACLALVLAVSYMGAGFFSRINVLICAVQMGSIVIGLGSMFLRPALPGELENGGRFLGFSLDNLRANMWSNYTADAKCEGGHCSFRGVFSILYPAMTGIMEGANLSGDLREPNRDIGRGTLMAVGTAIATYVLLIVAFAGSFPRDTLLNNMNVMANVSWPSKYVIVVGIMVSAFSSALGAVFGGSRVLQALGRDDLPPALGLSFFAVGSAHGDEPRRAVVFTWAIAQGGCLIGSLDLISPLITSFFLLSYSTVNLTCLLMDASGTPNFRPQFQHYSRAQSLAGTLLGLGGLFYLEVWNAVVATWFLVLLVVYISAYAPPKGWGDVSQSIIYHQVRRYLLRLDADNQHLKNWRPSVLLLVAPGRVNTHLLEFCNALKKGGLYVVGDAVVGPEDACAAAEDVLRLRHSWNALLRELNVKAVAGVTFARTTRDAFQQHVMLSGLGAMRPNCVCLQLPLSFGPLAPLKRAERERRLSLELRHESEEERPQLQLVVGEDAAAASAAATRAEVVVYERAADFCDVLRDVATCFQQHLIVASNFNSQVRLLKQHSCVDVWILGQDVSMDGTLSLQCQLAHVLHQEQDKLRVRILNVVGEGEVDTQEQAAKLEALAKRARLLHHSVHVIKCPPERAVPPAELLAPRAAHADDVRYLASLVRANSLVSTRVALLPLPSLAPMPAMDDAAYVAKLHSLAQGLPPVLFVLAATAQSLIPSDL